MWTSQALINMRNASILLLLFWGIQLCALDEMRMADRVFVDREVGISFRFPYECYMRNPFKGDIGGRAKADDGNGYKRMGYHFTSRLIADLPETIDPEQLDQVVDFIAGHGFAEYKDYKYYRLDPCFPHRHRNWAPKNIEARFAFSDEAGLLLIKHGDRFSALYMQGDDDRHDRVMNSLEVMKQVEHNQKQQLVTWNHHQTLKHYAITGPGESEPLKTLKRPQKWADAYELETEHFHVTTTCTPRFIMSRLDHLEEMYQGLRLWLPYDESEKIKYEVHVCKTKKEFHEIGDFLYGDVNKLFNVRTNSTLGGFFHPQTRALYTFTDKVKHSKMLSKVRLAHEFVHQYTYINSHYNMSVPAWFNEGIAVFFEEGFRSNGHKVVPTSLRMRLLKQVYKQQGFLGDMEKYMQGYGIGDVHQYGEAYAIVHQLLNQEGGQERLLEFWQGLGNRQSGITLFRNIFVVPKLGAAPTKDGYQEWEQSIQRYVSSGRAAKLTTKKKALLVSAAGE